MIVRVHGFSWLAYGQQVMPALACWLLSQDEHLIYQLYQQTRCAREEQCMPPPLRSLSTWSRALSFVQQLPLNAHARSEYEHLCSPERFTTTSDRYVYRHPPQLIQSSEALRTLWGALIETYCLPWPLAETNADEPTGVVIGRLPTTLHIRGWLATISVRAMSLFELLACERRCMPFGCQPGTPFSSFAGYLTPDEVQHLAFCLRDVQPPNQALAVLDYQRFRQQINDHTTFRMIDEVLPLHADAFISAVHLAAQQGIGLICSIG